MYKGLDSTDTEEEIGGYFGTPQQDVSLSSFKTQDSIENNSMVINIDHEEYKEVEAEMRNFEFKESRSQMTPFLTLKETQQEVMTALAASRIRLDIKPLHDISKNLHKISEDFQMWRKQD
jgi:hypothetical protein